MKHGASQILSGSLLVSLLIFSGHDAISAEVGHRGRLGESVLEDAYQKATQANNPLPQTALAKLLNEKHSYSPNEIDALLELAVSHPKLSQEGRAFARKKLAELRHARGDVQGAERSLKNQGYADVFAVIGPFDNEGRSGLNENFGPETLKESGRFLGESFPGKERHVSWRRSPNVFTQGLISADNLFSPVEHSCYFAASYFSNDSAKSSIPVDLWVGASGAYRLFFNGEEILKDEAYRGIGADRQGRSVLAVSGLNEVLVKICNDETGGDLSLRMADPKTGLKPASLNWVVSQESLKDAGKNRGQGQPTKAAFGPIARLDLLLADRSKLSAETAESYARYLSSTNGDDSVKHTARDLAKFAAETQSTAERELLAAELSEDRNQVIEHLKRAREAFGDQADFHPELILAEIEVEREGSRPLEVMKRYRQMNKNLPNDLSARIADIVLAMSAGLRITAIQKLDTLLLEHPDAAALWHLKERLLGLDGNEAGAARISDSRFLALEGISSQASRQFAKARQERRIDDAKQWLERIAALNPSSSALMRSQADDYASLGDTARSIVRLKKALAIAPEDTATMRSLATFYGQTEQVDKQRKLLKEILALEPTAKDVRDYLSHLEPEKIRADEAYAEKSASFLKSRNDPKEGATDRTLVDLTVTTVFDNGLSSEFRQVVFQPLTDSAAALARQYAFGYQADRQTVELRGAYVYRSNGKVETSFETGSAPANDPSVAMYTSTRIFYVQLPRLEPGDVVELQYRIDDTSSRNEYADYFGDIHSFGGSEPIRDSKYVLITPKKRNFYFDVQNLPGLKRSETIQGDQRIYTFSQGPSQPQKTEHGMPAWSELLGYVHVSTYKSWEDLSKWYWGLSRDQLELDDTTRKLAQDLTKGLNTDEEKVRAIYHWVISNTRYVALEFGIEGVKPRRCVQTVARGWGDCKDKATVIVALLKEVGVDSTVVILRTMMRGEFKSKLPSLAPFDHAIAYVPSLDLFLDGTAELTGMYELPSMDRGAVGVLVNQGKGKLVTLPTSTKVPNLSRLAFDISLLGNGSAQVAVDYNISGVNASSLRAHYRAQDTQRERFESDMSTTLPSFETDSGSAGFKTSNLEDVEQAVTIQARGTAKDMARVEGEHLSLPVTISPSLTSDYASLSKRTQVLAVSDKGKRERDYTIRIPKGYRVLSHPESQKQETSYGAFEVRYEEKNGVIHVYSSIYLNKAHIAPADYQKFRAFCEAADTAFRARLVVGK